MKTLFKSLPEDIMLPALRSQCQAIVVSVNEFLIGAGQDPDQYPTFASFMKKQGLPEAYHEQAFQHGWPIFSVEKLIRDKHAAALEAYVQDGGNLRDFYRLYSFETRPLHHVFFNDGVRGLHAHMGLIHCPLSVELARSLAKNVLKEWPQQALKDHIDSNLPEQTHLKAIALSASVGTRQYRGRLYTGELFPIIEIRKPLFKIEPDDNPGVGRTPGDLAETLAESLRRFIVVDMDDRGIAERMDAMADMVLPILEIPAEHLMRQQHSGMDVWNDLNVRANLMLKYLVGEPARELLAALVTHSVIVNTAQFYGLEFSDSDLLNTSLQKASEGWNGLSEGHRQSCVAILAKIGRICGFTASHFEQSGVALSEVQAIIKGGMDTSNPFECLSAKQAQESRDELWPAFVENGYLVHEQTAPWVKASLIAATVWARNAKVPSRSGWKLRPLYEFDSHIFKECEAFAHKHQHSSEVMSLTIELLIAHNLMNENTVNYLRMGGEVLRSLNVDIPESARSAMLENDLGM